jgi:nitrite reductase/ring-hydroxylating ferredoxin subunit
MIYTKYVLLTLTLLVASSEAFGTLVTKRAAMSMKRGRGLGELANDGAVPNIKVSSKGSKGGMAPSTSSSWIPVKGMTSGIKDLPTEEGSVKLIDTMAPALINGATNPTGAVCVIKYGPSVYCTSVGCASCQIPLNKAEVLGPTEETGSDPRICCSFCRATYNLRTGDRVTTQQGGGLMGGIAQNIFSKQKAGSLPIYALGEKNGQVLINLGNRS